jgi:hypothetical protein
MLATGHPRITDQRHIFGWWRLNRLENGGFHDGSFTMGLVLRAVEFVGDGSARAAAGLPYPTVSSKNRDSAAAILKMKLCREPSAPGD